MRLPCTVMVIMEGTGGYEYLLLKHLASHKLDAAVINPRRIRDFAKGIGLDAKTEEYSKGSGLFD